MLKTKLLLLASVAALVFSSQPVFAQQYSPYNNPYNNYGYAAPGNYPAPYNYNYRAPYNNYRSPYANNYSTPYNYGAPYNYGYRQNPYNRAPQYGNGYRPYYKKNNRGFDNFFDRGPFSNNSGPFKGKNGPFGKKGPFTGNSDFAEELWPGRDSIWDDALPADGPWNRDWGRAPWNRDYADMYGKEGGPDEWFNFSDPKEGAAIAWEDMLYTPNALGTMPGGWEAPTVVVPNPVDVGDEFKDAAGDMPGEIKNFSEGFTYGDDGYNNNPDAGSFGVGNKKKREGISISPDRNRH